MKKNLTTENSGSVVVETALIVTAIFFVGILLANFAKIINSSIELSAAVRTGSRYIVSQVQGEADIPQVVKNASSLPPANVTVTTNKFCECDGVAFVCGTTCGGESATYMTITGQYSAPLILNYPGLQNPYPLSKTIIVRTE